jgi:hypothetical protein
LSEKLLKESFLYKLENCLGVTYVKLRIFARLACLHHSKVAPRNVQRIKITHISELSAPFIDIPDLRLDHAACV